jgi:gliding motility-associated-like protein
MAYKDTSICVTEKLILDASFPNAAYLWQDGSVQPQYTVTQPGIYSVQVGNFCGTTSSAAIVNFENCGCSFFIPKAFTPDNNGNNDVFKPSYQCLFTNYSFKIFNRYGHVVFSTVNPSAAWDGMFKNQQQPIGAYVWLLQYIDKLSGRSRIQKGTVLLIR